MPCGCNNICPDDCAANTSVCTGNEPACTNSYSFTTLNVGDLITATHLSELETAINNERTDATRRYNASAPSPCDAHTVVACTNNDWSAYSFSGSRSLGDLIRASHFTAVKTANNEVVNDSGYGSLVATNFNIGDLIEKADITDLQNKINATRNACICDSHCSCDPLDCGCDGECPSDDPYYA